MKKLLFLFLVISLGLSAQETVIIGDDVKKEGSTVITTKNLDYFSVATAMSQDLYLKASDNGYVSEGSNAPKIIHDLKESGLWSKASLVYVPGLAYDSNYVYAIDPRNNSYIPLDVNRSSSAVRLNSGGYYEEINQDWPVIDWSNPEPAPSQKFTFQNTQLLTRPFSFAHPDWQKTGTKIKASSGNADYDVMSGYDFSTWLKVAATATANEITTTATGGVYKDNLLEVGKIYNITLQGTITGTAELTLYNNTVSSNAIYQGSGVIDTTFQFTATQKGFYFRLNGADIYSQTTFTVHEAIGFKAPAVDHEGTYYKNALKIVEDASSGNHYLYASGFNITTGNSYTYTFFAKKAGRNWIRSGSNSSFPARVFFDLENGVVGTEESGTGNIESVGNNWYKCSVTGTATSTTSVVLQLWLADADNSVSYTGDDTSGVLIWNASFENGPLSTAPYTLNGFEGSTVTRLKDELGIPDLQNKGVFSETQGTVVYNVQSVSTSSILFDEAHFFFTDIEGETSDWYIEHTRSGHVRVYDRKNSSYIYLGAVSNNDGYKLAVSWDKLTYTIALNGDSVATYSAASSIYPNSCKIRGVYSETEINSILFFDTSLSIPELKTLTR